MTITLGAVPDAGLATQAVVLALVGVIITIGVYGVVALIVKADDFGVVLAGATSDSAAGAASRMIGRGLVRGMPYFLGALGAVGTAAMVWVGGGILLHGLENYGVVWPSELVGAAGEAAARAVPAIGGLAAWLVGALGAGAVGVVAGLIAIPLVSHLLMPAWQRFSALRA
jgi:predicted DNA repair protein MutK